MSGPAAIRPAGRPELPEIDRLQRLCNPVPWGPRLLDATLSGPRAFSLIAESGGAAVGYLVAQRLVDVWHLLDVGVSPERRREGLGADLVGRLMGAAVRDRSEGVTLEVRVSNGGAIALYEGLGFLDMGRRPAYYSDNAEDALIMTWTPPAQAA